MRSELKLRRASASCVLLLALATACTELDVPSGATSLTDAGDQGAEAASGGSNGSTDAGADAGNGNADAGDGSSVPNPGNVTGTGGTPAGGCIDDELRCVVSSPGQRERCEDGTWSSAAACGDGQACVDPGGECRDVDPFCVGKGGTPVCVGAVMHACSAQGLSTLATDCGDARLCQAGLDRGECATCLAGAEYACSGIELQVCNEDGSAFEAFMNCPSAALCNATTGECSAAVCSSGSFVCEGDLLRSCNDDQTGFDDVQMCLAGLCDRVAGTCDVCITGDEQCLSGAPATCNRDGTAWVRSSCPAQTPFCAGQGQCVECRTTGDCSGTPGTCRAYECDSANGRCVAAVTQGATCTQPGGNPGYCSASGNCVECRTTADCGSNESCNSNGSCQRDPRCGDGFIDPGEQCDDSDVFDTNRCDSACKSNDYGACSGTSCYGGSGFCSDISGTGNGQTQCIPGCGPGVTCPALPGITAAGQQWTTSCLVQGCFILAGSPTTCPSGYHAQVLTSGTSTEMVCVLD